MVVPWNQIVRWAPQIISLSRELLQRSRRTPRPAPLVHAEDRTDLEQRIAALEENERSQAELVERMAEQQAELARALVQLHSRERLLIGIVAVLAIMLAALLVWQLAR